MPTFKLNFNKKPS